MTEGDCFYFPPFISFSLRSVSYSLCMSSGNCLIITDERLNVLSGIAGAPIQTLFGSLILPETPVLAPNIVPSAILICPVIPTCPPNTHFLPTLVEPAIPLWAAIAVWSPISTLWAICTRLSILTPLWLCR